MHAQLLRLFVTTQGAAETLHSPGGGLLATCEGW